MSGVIPGSAEAQSRDVHLLGERAAERTHSCGDTVLSGPLHGSTFLLLALKCTPGFQLASDSLGCKLPKGYGHVSPAHH